MDCGVSSLYCDWAIWIWDDGIYRMENMKQNISDGGYEVRSIGRNM